MPYSYPTDTPSAIKSLPAAAQKLWIAKFNEVHERTGDEEEARRAAWGMVKRAYVKKGDAWVRREGAGDESAILILGDLDGLPSEWIRILRLGENKLADGREPFNVDKESLKKILGAFEARGNDLVVDYEHSTMNTKGDPAPAAGWIKELQARDDGLWARVEWTDRAKEFIKANEYRYFSPVVSLSKEGRRVKELLNVALTNFPALAKLDALAAKFDEVEIEILGASEKDKAAQEARAKKYRIGIKDKGNVTKPSEWANVADNLFADPVNYAYPMEDLAQTLTAWRYWNKPANQEFYSPEERKIITERIKARARSLGKDLYTKEEAKNMDQIKKILGLSEEATEVEVILALKALKETADQAQGLKDEVKTATERASTAEGEVGKAKDRVKELEELTNKIQMPIMLTSALEIEGGSSIEVALVKIEALKVQVADGAKAKQDLMALKAELKDKDAKMLLDWAVQRGRTTPAELAKDENLLFKMASENTAAFKAIMESRPDGFMAPVGSQLNFSKDDKGRAIILDDQDKEMCRLAGIPEEEYLKAKTEEINQAGKAA